MRSSNSCSTHGYFIVHLQVFGIISGVVMVIILYSRIFQTTSYYENENVHLQRGHKLDWTLLLCGRNDNNVPWKIKSSHIASRFGSLLLHRANISISLDLLNPCRGTHNSFITVYGKISWLRWSATAEPRGDSRANLIKCVQPTAGKLNVEVKTICANFPLQFPGLSQRGKRMLVNVRYEDC